MLVLTIPHFFTISSFFLLTLSASLIITDKMVGAANKKENRERFHAAKGQNALAQLPRKRFYRQRAHANPFSDHSLE